MRNLLDQARGKSEKDRKIIALTTSGIVVAVIFTIWASSLISRLSSTPTESVVVKSEVEKEQTASVIDSIKRKASLLFGEGSPLQDMDIFSKPVEYKAGDSTQTKDADERDLQAILDDFNSSTTQATTTEIDVPESEL